MSDENKYFNSVFFSLFYEEPLTVYRFTHKLVQTKLCFENLNSARTPASPRPDLLETLYKPTSLRTESIDFIRWWEDL